MLRYTQGKSRAAATVRTRRLREGFSADSVSSGSLTVGVTRSSSSSLTGRDASVLSPSRWSERGSVIAPRHSWLAGILSAYCQLLIQLISSVRPSDSGTPDQVTPA